MNLYTGSARSNFAQVKVYAPNVILLLVLLLSRSNTVAQTPAPPTQATARAQAAATALLSTYNPETGLFRTTGWWNSANAITALADTARLAPKSDLDRTIRSTLGNTLTQAPHKFPNFLNEFYDDEGWWALAWVDAYDLTHDKRYLHASETIFNNMTTGWSDTCGGGIWWKKDNSHYKNAIANELFLSVAAHLAQRTHRKQRRGYLDWANREWTWFAASGMINADSLVNDGLRIDPDNTCHNNGRTTWSYNQGVVLGGLAALSHASKTPALLVPANRIATAALTHLTDAQGILHDPCEPNCGEDGVQFKGIFTRDLGDLNHASPTPAYTHFLQTQAESLWNSARTPDNRFPTTWSAPSPPGPPTPGNAGAQASALDALNAAALNAASLTATASTP